MLQEPVNLHKNMLLYYRLLSAEGLAIHGQLSVFHLLILFRQAVNSKLLNYNTWLSLIISLLFLLAEWQNRISSVNYKNYCFV